jgi:hypothetical protein
MERELEPGMAAEFMEEGLVAVAESEVENVLEIAHRLVVMDGH